MRVHFDSEQTLYEYGIQIYANKPIIGKLPKPEQVLTETDNGQPSAHSIMNPGLHNGELQTSKQSHCANCAFTLQSER